VDGMDVTAVYRETLKAVEHCRTGKGPYFVEAMTYRYRGHSMADPELYRLKDEVEKYRKRDAIDHLKAELMKNGQLDEAGWKAINDRVERVVEDSIIFADASPNPAIDTLFDYVTKEPGDA